MSSALKRTDGEASGRTGSAGLRRRPARPPSWLLLLLLLLWLSRPAKAGMLLKKRLLNDGGRCEGSCCTCCCSCCSCWIATAVREKGTGPPAALSGVADVGVSMGVEGLSR
jgi:hypothetical protein